MTWKPELLAPAKNLERLKVAILYGADAVYVGGQKYGLRARADNFTRQELASAAAFAHQHNAKLYVTLNAFLHDEDFDGLEEYCAYLESIDIDALIISDLGVLREVRKACSIDIHLSTQASCLNQYAAKVWKQMGVTRIILGREVSIQEAGVIRASADIDIELFIHGAMCMSYSGHCTISNFTAGRDSNRGGCSQSCRFSYQLHPYSPVSSQAEMRNNLQPDEAVTFLSSKDLAGADQIVSFFQHRICSLKIEGRMKSSLYVATTCKTYRRLIDAYAQQQQLPLTQHQHELETLSRRDYCDGSLSAPAEADSVYLQGENPNIGSHVPVGIVLDTTDEHITAFLSTPLQQHHQIELMPFQNAHVFHTVENMYNLEGQSITAARQQSVVHIPRTASMKDIAPLNVIRAQKSGS